MKTSGTKVLLAFAAVYVIWGSTYLAIRYAIETIPPFLMMGIRSLIAGSALYVWSFKKGERVRRDQIFPLLILGILFFLLGHGLLAWAQKTVASGIAAVLSISDPLWIGVIESFTIKEFRLNRKQIAGLILGFVGVGLLFFPTSDTKNLQINPFGALIILMSAVSWSVGAVYSRVAKLPKSAVLSAGLELIIGGILLCIVAWMIGELRNFHLSMISLRSFLALAYLVIFGSIITFTAYVWLLTVTTATRVATHTYVNPVIAVLLGWAFAGERFTLLAIFASGVIVFSVYLMLESKQIIQAVEKIYD
jgi:drug/metabolite transporter (DMT)-like permease